jgi:hypothetical protein
LDGIKSTISTLVNAWAVCTKIYSATCLKSLYKQQFESVKQLCPLEIRPTEEVDQVVDLANIV